jgi:hypothetical protein
LLRVVDELLPLPLLLLLLLLPLLLRTSRLEIMVANEQLVLRAGTHTEQKMKCRPFAGRTAWLAPQPTATTKEYFILFSFVEIYLSRILRQ